MGGVFISHSSADKKLIVKLAVDLTTRGIPIWFDSWELETGDKLADRIFTGIDDTTFLIIALSPNSIKSEWVGRELAAALAKEDRSDRKVILPIKIAPCDPPPVLANRIFADFTSGYLRGLDTLEDVLKRRLVDFASVPLDRQIIPLSFSKALYLDRVGLQTQYERCMGAIQHGSRVQSKQLLPAPDEKLDKMRDMLRTTIETYGEHPKYNPETEHTLRQIYERVRKLDESLTVGVSDIANGIIAWDQGAFLAEASHWYARIVRHDLLARLLQIWRFSSTDDPPYADGAISSPLSSAHAMTKMLETETVRQFDVFRAETHEYFKVWIPADSTVGEWFWPVRRVPERLIGHWAPDLIYKWIVPQMVALHLLYSPSVKIVWDLQDWMIGLS
jgi:hypothetical protein